ncbi:alpha/beta hydrolase family protein [uncultured Shimia sp.]|uniref:alpha/beta hydrolase n=1 Tax=uncultured Shimia sp. TaxID=573152 RepID=UPI0025D43F78|nr:alpha/beta hydrolase family protein [uncultured Shimia sp.]
MTIRVLVLGLVTLMPVQAIAATIVLVHGAFVGSWYWDPIADGLREMGHSVVAVDLNTGGQTLADNPADAALEDHIAIVVAAINAQDGPVVLVSHSYGGRPSTGAWDIARDRIAAIIFLEAVAPYGTGNFALPEETRQRSALASRNPKALAQGILLPPAYLENRYPGQDLHPHSIAAAHAALRLTRGELPKTPGAYVLGSNSKAALFKQYAQKVREQRKWTIWEIESGHDMVHDAAEILTRLIDKLSTELIDVDLE